MDRTFHSKVDWWYWLLMAVTAFLLFDFFWFHYTIATLLVAAVMIFEIEMLIHTRYIVTGSGKLLIETGRFVADKTILLNTIVSMCEVNSFSIAPALSVHRVEITYRVVINMKKFLSLLKMRKILSDGYRKNEKWRKYRYDR